MKDSILKIEMAQGNWLVDVFSQTADTGVYDLISPSKETTVRLREEEIYGFKYNITAPNKTAFKLYLDDTVIAEGQVGSEGAVSGRGVI